MKDLIIRVASPIRAIMMRSLKPKERYLNSRSLKPLSRKYGFDRGQPIDRFYIEKFMDQNQQFVKGYCLEVHDDAYLKTYGGTKVTNQDILDIDNSNRQANVYGDLRNLKNVDSNKYDCLVITHTLGLIDDIEAAISECYRILKPGGTLLVTTAVTGPCLEGDRSLWRLTPASAKYLFAKKFGHNLKVSTFGNLLACQGFLIGLAQEEFSLAELDFNDPVYPLVIGIRATKKGRN